ncbi:MAG: thiolase domain-containing protein [Chloroflexi bacterium]|nr:thiolase domain-containing protein [Chloroflexota bacterium]
MRPVYIAGLGQTEVGEHWELSLRELALMAAEEAVQDAGGARPEALYVGNMLAGELSHQEHLGALIADFCGWRGIEAATIEAAGASGGAALRQGVIAVASGLIETALVLGVEKMTDKVGAGVNAALATSSDSDYEAAQGVTPAALAGLLMRRYMHEFGAELKDFAGFSVNAHANAKTNPKAMYRNTITAEAYLKAGMVADPVNMFDTAPEADGAAAVLLAADPARAATHPPIRIAGSGMATDSLAVHDRHDPLALYAAAISARKAYEMAGISPDAIGVFELHDGFTVLAALSLEACGFAPRGAGCKLAQSGDIALTGRIPISTFGGLKARGNPGGATGLYQAVEVALQLRGEAGPNQIGRDIRWGMAQSLGGSGATAVTHILERIT